MPPTRTSPEARKMRKGTHSCFECRRRKIRCIFPQENPEVCTECFARGSKCIDQENASTEAIVDQRKNLRGRVSKLEALVDSLLEDRGDRSTPDALKNLKGEPFPHTTRSNDTPVPSNDGHETPHLSFYNNVPSTRAESTTTTTAAEELPIRGKSIGEGLTANGTVLSFQCNGEQGPEVIHDVQSEASKAKYERTRRALLSPLPSYDEMIATLRSNSDWWTTFRQKCPGTSGRYTNLLEFATDALTKGYPPQLGVVVLGVGISTDSDNIEKYMALVDREIICDDEYASTLEGMELLILQAKCYADIGQPRKAWLCYRRGLMFAQLMGLHRNHSISPERDSIWWCLYQGDRFISLLLGLPHGINDAHCDLELKGPMADPTKSPFSFLVSMSKLAGKVIDRTQGTAPSSYSAALDLDTEIERIAADVPPGWWDIAAMETATVNAAHSPHQAADLRERLLSQIAFHQIRVYLHLPFLLQSTTNPKYEYSRNICLNSAREMLRLYHMTRSGNGQPLYECKAVDFLGFTASILVVLGLLGYGQIDVMRKNPVQYEADWRMIEITMDIFQRASSEKGGKVAAQSYSVLEQLSMVRYATEGCGDCNTKIAIPYFGTISIRRVQGASPQNVSSSSNSTVNTPPSMGSADSPGVHPGNTINHLTQPSTRAPKAHNDSQPKQHRSNLNDPFLVYDGFYMPNALDANQATIGGEDGLGNFPAPVNQWNIGAMDIDQDWDWFLNDANSMGIGMGNGGGIQGQGSQQHSGMQAGLHGTYFP